MSAATYALRWTAPLAVAALIAGCGHGTDRAAAPTATPAPSPVPTSTPHRRLSITAPPAGTTVRAGRVVTVAGRATPGTTVLLAANCSAAGCQSVARATATGRWRGVLRPRARRTVLSASTISSGPQDRRRIRVRQPVRRAAPRPVPEAEPQATARPRPTRVVLIGDSLAVGIKALLPPLLRGDDVSIDGRTGRPLAEGMRILARTDVSSRPTVLAISLFTNDDPRAVDALTAGVRRTLDAVGPDGCAVWATIVRPPVGDVSYRAANARLRALEAQAPGRLILVPWAETVAARPGLIGPDGVHPTPAGYGVRASLYAEAIRSCGG